METETDLRHNVTSPADPALAATPGVLPVDAYDANRPIPTPATPLNVVEREREAPIATAPAVPYGVIDTYGLPAHSPGLSLMPGDMIAAVFAALLILGPLFIGASHAG